MKKIYTWEEAIIILRKNPAHRKMIFDAYLTNDLLDNVYRFCCSEEFKEVLRIIKQYCPNAKNIADIPAGNGIASFSFAKSGFNVSAVEPDPSMTLGRGAIDYIKQSIGLQQINIVDSFGERLPLASSTFDVIYIRQGLHHSANLKRFVKEAYRILKPGGLFLAMREHVVDNYGESLKAFLDTQIDHQLYGGENAFTLKDYKDAISSAGFYLQKCYGPFESGINLYPKSYADLFHEIQTYKLYKILKAFLPESIVRGIILKRLGLNKDPGRLFSFIALK